MATIRVVNSPEPRITTEQEQIRSVYLVSLVEGLADQSGPRESEDTRRFLLIVCGKIGILPPHETPRNERLSKLQTYDSGR